MNRIISNCFPLSLGLTLAVCFVVPVRSTAQTIEYANNPGALDFTVGDNWVGGIAPGGSDTANINGVDGVTNFPYIDTSVSIARFQIAAFDGNSGGLELRSGAFLQMTTTSASFVGARGVGHLRIFDGATLNNPGGLLVGWGSSTGTDDGTGDGTVIQDGGSYYGLTGATNTIGSIAASENFPASVGTWTLNSGIIDLLGPLNVGLAGTGTLTVHDGSFTTASWLQIGRGAGGNGSVIQTGGSVTVNRANADYGLVLNHATVANGTALYETSGGTLTVGATNKGMRVGGTGDNSSAIFRIIDDTAEINIANDYTQNVNGTLALVIGSGISPINAGRDVLLDGALDVFFTETPSIGQEFTLINYAGSLGGAFATFDSFVDSPEGPNSVGLSIDYGTGSGSSVVLTVESIGAPPLTPGDFNGDGNVDGADFVIWQTNFPNNTGMATLDMGDANNDGNVDGADFVIWQTNFPTIAGSVTAVPEPHAIALVGLGGIFIFGYRRRFGKSSR